MYLIRSQGANYRRLHYAQGKTLGRSSARNFEYYHRQTLGSSQKWATETGDQSYTFANLLPYYKKSVHYTAPNIPYPNSTNEQDPTVFSVLGGPLQVSFGKYDDPFASWAQKGLQAIGQAAINGFQSGDLIGSAYAAATVDPRDSTRSSSESSFLRSVCEMTTIKVYNNTIAGKIQFVEDTATGVAVSSEVGSRPETIQYTLSARKEIIVSAGVFYSPQILMLSGIGPRRILQSVSIPVLKDLPGVGQNLWDQPWYGTSFRVDILTGSAGLNNPSLAAAAIESYLDSASGPLSVSGVGVLGFEKLPEMLRSTLSIATQQALNDTFPADWPDIEFLPASDVIRNQSNFATQDPIDGFNYATIATALAAPFSRGDVSINSSSVSDPPLVDPNWLTNLMDVELAIAAFKRQRQLWSRITNVTIGEEYFPGPSVQSDAQILQFIRNNFAPLWHAAGTCKMGTTNDSMAVIDSSMRVYGTKGLRIVDASSFPFLPPGHPQATIYALAEKVAEEILNRQIPDSEVSK